MVKLLIILLLLASGCIPLGTGWGYDTSARHQLVINEHNNAISELHQKLEAAANDSFTLSSYYPIEGY